MVEALSEAPTLPSPEPRGWIIAAGVIEILLGITCLLISASVASVLEIAKPAAPHGVGLMVGYIVVAILYLLLALFFSVAGTRLPAAQKLGENHDAGRQRNLAGNRPFRHNRPLDVFAPALEMQHLGSPARLHAVFVIMAIISVSLGVLLPLAFLIFFTRKSVRAAFLNRGQKAADEVPGMKPSSPPFRLPVPLLIVAVFEAFGVTTVLWMMARPAALVFGFLVHGWEAILVGLAYSIFSGAAAWLVYKRRLAGWNIAFIKALVSGSSLGLSLLVESTGGILTRPGWPQLNRNLPPWFPAMMHGVFIVSTVWIGVYVLFLIYARKFIFAKPPADSAPA